MRNNRESPSRSDLIDFVGNGSEEKDDDLEPDRGYGWGSGSGVSSSMVRFSLSRPKNFFMAAAQRLESAG